MTLSYSLPITARPKLCRIIDGKAQELGGIDDTTLIYNLASTRCLSFGPGEIRKKGFISW
jgi:hypothetical protein